MIKIKHILLLLLATAPFLNGCNNKDDVAGIFTGRTWKMRTILYENERPGMDYWPNTEEGRKARDKSIELLNKENTFIIRFQGNEADGVISGSFSGNAATTTIAGQWTANGENNEFSINQQSKTDSDVLGNAFIAALSTAYKYSGDYNSLRIYFKEGKSKVTKMLLLFSEPIQ